MVFDGNVALDAKGSYRHEFHFQPDLTDVLFDLRATDCPAGLYCVCVCYGDACCEALIPVLPPVGSAIVVAGYGGKIWNNLTGQYGDLQKSVNSLAEYAYMVLRQSLGLPGDRICFLHPNLSVDCDLDGLPDVDALPTAENLKFAIENWALDKYCIGQQQDALRSPVIIYIVSGSAAPEAFYISDSDPVLADELASWLGALQAGIQQRQVEAGVPLDSARDRALCPVLPATTILEFPLSGSFVRGLGAASPGLTVVTSSEGNILGRCRSHIVEAGGMLSFSRQFWSRVFLGGSVSLAWNEARQFTLNLYGDQSPQLSADSNSIPNEPSDELVVSGHYLQPGQTDGFRIQAESCCVMDEGTIRLDSLCVLGESIQMQVCVQHSRLACDCAVYVVVFPPANVIRPNVIVELTYSREAGCYVGSIPEGLDIPGQWQLLYVAVDSDGQIAVTSRQVTAIGIDLDPDAPASCPAWPDLVEWDGLGLIDDYTALLEALTSGTLTVSLPAPLPQGRGLSNSRDNLSRLAGILSRISQSDTPVLGMESASGLIDRVRDSATYGDLEARISNCGNSDTYQLILKDEVSPASVLGNILQPKTSIIPVVPSGLIP
jgi:hypothetical protein